MAAAAGEVSVTTAIELRGIGKRFPGVVANHDVDITIESGTIHALVGENGAGKSTLMKILYGVQKPDEGSIRVDGQQVSFTTPADAIAAGIGMVFQHFMLADNLTVLENVVLGAEKLRGIGDDARAAITEISQKYGFGLDPDELVETPRGGGAATRRDPQGPLPRGARSSSSTSRPRCSCRRRSTRCSRTSASSRPQGHTLIFISHKLDEVRAIADEITVVRRGTTVGLGATRPT